MYRCLGNMITARAATNFDWAGTASLRPRTECQL